MTENNKSITQRINSVRDEISNAAKSAGRDPSSIRLLAVSKTKPVEDIEAAFNAGQVDFGENYLQEALSKIQLLDKLPLVWHFIGRIQSNITRQIAESFDWVHTLDSFKHARRLSEQRPADMPPLNVCLQINISDEDSKGGIPKDQAETLAAEIIQLPGLCLRGLMSIPEATSDIDMQKQSFAALAKLLGQLNEKKFNLDTLSMGMSGDMAAAISQGSTIVRVGTAIFGPRNI